jgi:O-antigen/teichoic acid export membrane protein
MPTPGEQSGMPTEADPELADSIPVLNEPEEEQLTGAQVRQRAAAGALLVAGRGAALQVLSFGGNLVLARLLVPRDFGLVALGTAVITFGSLMANSGVGSALIRRPEPPARADYQSVVGFQLVLTVGLAALVIPLSLVFGKGGAVAAVMVSSLPLLALRTPGAVALERLLLYRRLVAVEITENVLYYGWAITTVALGFGVWGLATGVVVRTLGGTIAMLAVAPVGLLRPRLDWTRLRPIVKFGAQLQGTGAVNFIRDQVFNLAVAATAGVATLGLWTLVIRVMYVPGILFQALWRVSFPAMSRLMGAGEDPRPLIKRSTGLVAVATGAALTGIVGAGPHLLPGLFGSQWGGASDAVPSAALGLLLVGPVSVSAAGYLAAAEMAGTILRGAILHTAALFIIAIPLVSTLGLWALGLGLLASCLVEAVVLGRGTWRGTGVNVAAQMLVPTVAAVVAGAAGWFAASEVGTSLFVAILFGIAAEALYIGIVFAWGREIFLDTSRTLIRAIRPRG